MLGYFRETRIHPSSPGYILLSEGVNGWVVETSLLVKEMDEKNFTVRRFLAIPSMARHHVTYRTRPLMDVRPIGLPQLAHPKLQVRYPPPKK